MISISEAIETIESAVDPLERVAVTPDDALGCGLAVDVQAPFDVPQFVSSAMDGIAIRFDDLADTGPWRLRIQGVIGAGSVPERPLSRGCAVKIMTGAPLIDGSDTVIRVEDVRFEDDYVIVDQRPQLGKDVRPAGDDIKRGDLLFEKGTVVTPIDVGVLTSIGIASIPVTPRPRVAIFSTGSELIRPGEELLPGKLYDSNIAVLRSLLGKLSITPTVVDAPVPDDPGRIAETLAQCLEQNDLVISTGGVSVGDFDFLPGIVERLGGETLFKKVKVKPGKPCLFARFPTAKYLGLPGNPVSVVATFHLYVRRLIARLMGFSSHVRSATGILQADLLVTGNRFCLVGARIEESNGEIKIHPATRQASGRLSSLRGMNGFVMLDERQRSLAAGDAVQVEWIE
jgi:molybdopterin molybdotransferase